MNLKTLTTLATLLLAPISVFALAEIAPESRIESVSLFKDGALVTRMAEIDFPAGKSVVSFPSLPTAAQKDALQASLAASEVGVVRNATLFIPQDPEEIDKIEELRDRIQELRQSIAEQDHTKHTATQELNFARTLSRSFSEKFGKIGEGEPLNIEQAKETWSYTQSIIAKSNATIKEADKVIKDLGEEIEDIEKELKDELQKTSKLRSVAAIEVEFSQATRTQMTISYIVSNANWNPRYELRAKPSEKSLDFGYFAAIKQNTGEDWNEVELSLHTNQVNRRGNVPELYPLIVNKFEPRGSYLKTRGLSRSADFEESLEFAAGAPATLNQSAKLETEVAVSSSTVSFQIKLPGKPTIPSAIETKTLPVLEQTFAAKYWSEVVPRAQLDAYLIGETINELEMPILPGQALAFVDGKLSSKVYLQKTLPQEELKLSLGTDENIVVKRREGASKDSSTGFIDKTTTLKREYFNTVSSFHTIAHDVVIIDQFPLSRNSKIEIKPISPTEDSVEFDEKKEGVFQWKGSIPAGSEKTFTTSFQIVYPRDWEIAPKL
ncbi:mucoidy inhibitor MuiA family protein [Puniceicoccaceae bacterium K14]|nr:mucoidy inhibitor MuiA family protein [Puniceicoccaceae bacterium K14]